MILLHGGGLQRTPARAVGEERQRPLERTEQRRARILLEDKARDAVLNRIGEAADRADHWDRAVALTVHLIEAARLESRGHQKEIGAALDEMRERLVEADVGADPVRMLARQPR